jgi:hypothetical protein
MKTRELRRQCERFTKRMIAEGANPDELAGLLMGSMMRLMRDRGISRELYLQGCALLWDQNNPSDAPVED